LSGSYRFWGIAFALAGTVLFAFRPILIKLGYAAHPVSATTLLFLRMSLSLPFFLAMAWWMRGGAPIARRDWFGIVGLGLLGYYLASLLDFLGLQYISAGIGRLIMFLYPTLVIVLSALFLKKNPTLKEVAALRRARAGDHGARRFLPARGCAQRGADSGRRAGDFGRAAGFGEEKLKRRS